MTDISASAVGKFAPAADRVHLLDALRAIALFGVILFNITGMVGAWAGSEVLSKATPLDLGFIAFDLILIQGKARACFALLFGVGFGLMMDRAAASGRRFVPFHLRRMTVLLLIGCCNLAFLFFGDILILYALIGMLLLAFRGLSNRALLVSGLVLLLVPPVAIGLGEAVTGAPLPNLAGLDPAQAETWMATLAPAYRSPHYLDFVAANLRYYLMRDGVETADAIMYDLSVLGLFVIGLWTARCRVLFDVEHWRPFLRRVAWWTLPIGLVFSLVFATRRMGIEATGVLHGLVTASYAGLAFMAFGYVALLALFLTGKGEGLQRALAPAGRMALTGYLASNAIGGFVWYGWGLGQLGKWNGAAINLLGCAIFAALWLFSALWMRAFRFGPAEWIWRSLSYGKAQPLLR
ncbi:hypothetical protein SLG_07560 [Sphingobium sp. SYK-6]|uniref:DUF418 domain-containing protein n=1 Tax=Sphingobium sp. (strain NBRC 103272 / SYK-6) TaxID=627192 RepID=UPI0002276AC0|nr:DUF418 domain-containing protein [Sphingobium sp. SYK-6]BAK65431.1 hypothetical protein SLG_07560 [Sphingobium sp. SYK-6]